MVDLIVSKSEQEVAVMQSCSGVFSSTAVHKTLCAPSLPPKSFVCAVQGCAIHGGRSFTSATSAR